MSVTWRERDGEDGGEEEEDHPLRLTDLLVSVSSPTTTRRSYAHIPHMSQRAKVTFQQFLSTPPPFPPHTHFCAQCRSGTNMRIAYTSTQRMTHRTAPGRVCGDNTCKRRRRISLLFSASTFHLLPCFLFFGGGGGLQAFKLMCSDRQ